MKYPIPFDERELKLKAIQMRKDIVLETFSAGSGHPGGSLSAVEMFIVLYNCILKHDSENSRWEDRDKFVLSKAHITPAYYSILSRTGYIDPKELVTFRKLGSFLQGHPKQDIDHGIEIGGGSLGQNFSIAGGIALGMKLKNKQTRVFVMSSEGELQEGSMWETAMSIPHFKLNNLCLLVDYNRLQIDGKTEEVMEVEPLDKKFSAFNWNVININGHEVKEVYDALKKFEEFSLSTPRPTAIIAKTIKGKGVAYMADVCGWHGKAPNKEEYDKAIQELEAQEKTLTQ
ncbi:MAG: transketolase [Candidatus Gracilibacteria bacterium]|jgi:transketolase